MKFLTRLIWHEEKIRKANVKANTIALRRCGAYVRKIARDFVRHKSNPNKHSEPLSPPYDHYGLKKSIVFAAEPTAVYIGPRYLRGGLANVARLHEFGGEAVVRDIDMNLWDGVEEGDVAPVTEINLRKKDRIIRRDAKLDPKTGRRVFWIKIGHSKSARQRQHSTRLYKRMAKKYNGTKLVKYPPRPYMAPALMKAMPHLSGMWKNVIK